MRLRDAHGVELNADFGVEVDEGYLSLVLESAGGRTAGADRPRNDQYVPALRLLLERLRDRQAVLLSALVASAWVSGLSEDERTLVKGPLKLSGVADVEQLRLEITSAQGRVGLRPGARKEGNNGKRIRLRLDVPGYRLEDAAQLAADLAGLGSEPVEQLAASRELPTAKELLAELTGVEILTATGRPNTVVDVQGNVARVQTERSPDGSPVEIGEVQKGLDKLAERGSVKVTVDELGHRSSFVGAVLAALPGTGSMARPREWSFANRPVTRWQAISTSANSTRSAVSKSAPSRGSYVSSLPEAQHPPSARSAATDTRSTFSSPRTSRSARSAQTKNAATCSMLRCWPAPLVATPCTNPAG